MTVNRGAGVETASTMWAVVKWDVFYGASYFLMVFSDNLVSIWVDKRIVDSDNVNMLALALFIIATAGLESMMMVSGSGWLRSGWGGVAHYGRLVFNIWCTFEDLVVSCCQR